MARTIVIGASPKRRARAQGWGQRHLLYWGEINDRPKAAWTKGTEGFDPARQHLLVSFLASCLHVHLRACLKPLAPGLTPRSRLEKFAALQMLDVHFPTSDGRELVFCRSTPPEKDHQRRLAQWGWELPPQSPPPITQKGQRLPE